MLFQVPPARDFNNHAVQATGGARVLPQRGGAASAALPRVPRRAVPPRRPLAPLPAIQFTTPRSTNNTYKLQQLR